MVFFETIKVKNNELQNLEYHQNRMDKTLWDLLGSRNTIDLSKMISVPPKYSGKIMKCRLTYDTQIIMLEFENYKPQIIQSLKLVFDDEIEYNYKYKNRERLNKLYAHKCNCDEVLIVKNGFITDTSFSNIVFTNGKDRITPSYPLLNGTMRQNLLDRKIITEKAIRISDLDNFQSAFLINAMLDIESTVEIKREMIFK